MFGIDRTTGLRVRITQERNRHARIAAAPFVDALTEVTQAAGIDVAGLILSANSAGNQPPTRQENPADSA